MAPGESLRTLLKTVMVAHGVVSGRAILFRVSSAASAMFIAPPAQWVCLSPVAFHH